MRLNLPPLALVVLDTETTGFVPRVHRVIEFASTLIENGEVIKETEQLFSIDGPIPPHVTSITHIRNDDLKGKPTFDELRQAVLAAIPEHALIVGQNIEFDIGMLKGEGIDVSDRPWIDTSMLASLVFPELKSYSLGYVSEVLKLPHEPRHRALGDVRATMALLEKCWERLCELPADAGDVIRDLAKRATPGYKLLFSHLQTTGSAAPAWLKMPEPMTFGAKPAGIVVPKAEAGTVTRQEESLAPETLETILHTLADQKDERHLVAVKNIEACMRRLILPPGTAIHYPPSLLVDPDAVARLLKQTEFTADEATLAMKLYLYAPDTRGDLPLHGDENAVWNAKIAATMQSAVYLDMLKTEARVIILDHRELLTRAAEGTLPSNVRVIVDDASMLEESATKAFGWYAPLKTIRASAQGDAAHTRIADLAELWTEKTRGGGDVRYLTVSDLSSPDTRGLIEQLTKALPTLPASSRGAFDDLLKMLDPENLHGRIAWIETRMNGERIIQSVPRDTAKILKETLYDRLPVTLLAPPAIALPMILPRGMNVANTELSPSQRYKIPVDYPSAWNMTDWLHATRGKSILLLGSRRLLEELFMRNADELAAKGVTLLCQGLSGGQSRMQAQFSACPGPAVLAVTPWTYETMELPPKLVDRLVLASLPFDHPSHALVSQRSESFASGFGDYMLPRLMMRLFRILRTFSRHRTDDAVFAITDARLLTKDYGRQIRAMLALLSNDQTESPATPVITPAKKPSPKKSDKAQGTLF